MMHTLILLAEDAAPQGPGIIQFLPLIAIAVVFYLLLIRPMKQAGTRTPEAGQQPQEER